jgi:ribulose-phosphate 3-epimerase
MSIVCPTVLAKDEADFKTQIDKVAGFAKRIQIDLEDGVFAPSKSIPLAKVWWPKGIEADIHVMYQNPQDFLGTLIKLKPSMVIVHAESTCDIPKLAADLRVQGIKTGLAILQPTTIDSVKYIFPHVQHLLIFSGDLGHFGGKEDFGLTHKITEAKAAHNYLEIGWDGGVTAENAKELACAGVDVLNVGGAIQNADNPQEAYAKIVASLSGQK